MGTKNNPGQFDCYANAQPDEPMFILLGRDASAPMLVELWARLRLRQGENPAKVAEAQTCADTMRAWLRSLGKAELDTQVIISNDPIDAYDLVTHLERQRTFSEKAFGPGTRAKGVVDHIKKELVEIEQNPSDLNEWIDVAMLAFDGAWRAGFDPVAIAAAFEAKLIKNENREWPDWRTADPEKAIEHVRS